MSSPTKVSFPAFACTIAGELYQPAEGSNDRKGAAIVISHPMTGVKEQTSADYARALSKASFWALTFDAAYQGESTGEPKGLEDPVQRAEDNKSGVTYLTTLKGKIDPQRIGMLGICASGGYTSYATQSDIRVRCLATVSAACVGRMTRNGGLHEGLTENPEAIKGALKAAGEWRTAEMAGQHPEAPAMFEIDESEIPEGADSFFKDAAAYYGTKRGLHPRSDHKVPPVSYDLMVPYDSFDFQHLISPRPLLMIAGTKAQTLHYSRDVVAAVQKAGKGPAEFFTVEGKNHFDLYDNLEKTGPKLVEFFGQNLV